MIIGRPKIRVEGDHAYYEAAVTLAGETSSLWYAVPTAYHDMICDRADAAAVALLIPAMLAGEDVRIEGPVSERIAYNVAGPLQAILRLINPELRRVKVVADETARPQGPAAGVATGISGGVDSFSVLYGHYFHPPSPSFRLTHLLFHSLDAKIRFGGQRFRRGYEALRPLADALGLPLVPVHSNMGVFYSSLGFVATHTPRNASVPLVLSNGIGRWFYASGQTYKKLHGGGFQPSATADPVILPMISSEVVDCISADGEFTRVEKTLRVTRIEPTRRFLNVCQKGFDESNRNCSRCSKCMRTMLTLDIAGVLPEYGAVFDLEEFGRAKAPFLKRIASSKDTYFNEIRTFAEQRGYRLSDEAS